MITEFLIGFFYDFVRFMIGPILAIVPPVPGWVNEGIGYANEGWSYLNDFSTWIPVSFAVDCFSAVIAAYLINLGMELTRMLISYFTFGGGAH